MGNSIITSSINETSNIIYNAIGDATSNASTSTNCKSNNSSNLIQIDTEKAIKNFNSDSSKSKIQSNIQSVSKNISNETGENLDKTTTLVTNVTNAMSNAYINTCNNSQEIRNLAVCPSSNKFIIDGITESDYLKAVKNCILTDDSVAKAEFKMTENLAGTEFSKGLHGYAWWIVIFIIAFFLTIFIMIFFGILFLFIFYRPLLLIAIILLPTLIVLILLTIGYFPKWWPYEELNSLDSSEENDKKRKNNLIKFIIFGVITLILFALFMIFLFQGFRETKKKSITQRILQRFNLSQKNKESIQHPIRTPPSLKTRDLSIQSDEKSLSDEKGEINEKKEDKENKENKINEIKSRKGEYDPPYLEAERRRELFDSGVPLTEGELIKEREIKKNSSNLEKQEKQEKALQLVSPSTVF